MTDSPISQGGAIITNPSNGIAPMDTKISFREFLKQPAAKQLIIVLVVAVSTLFAWVKYLDYQKSSLQIQLQNCEVEKGNIKQEYGDKMLTMAQNYDREMKEALQKQIEEFKLREAERERKIDEVIRDANRTISSQTNVKRNLKRITKTLSNEN
jgi:uncharacterized membrane protein